MNIDTFKKIVKEIEDNFISNQKIINEAINEEIENGYIVNFNDIITEIRKS